MASFADVVKKQRKEGSSRTGALASAIGQKTLESIDPRKFFDQSGVLTTLFPSLKAYKAKGVGDKDGTEKNLNKLATLQASGDAATRVTLEEMVIKLDNNLVYSRLIAKNSTVLPQMARDANLTKQNIGRLLNLFGGVQATKTSDYFKRAGEREAAVEAAMERSRRAVTPTKVTEEKKDSTSFLATLFAPLIAVIAPLIASLKTFGTELANAFGISKFLTGEMGLLRAAITALLSPLGLMVAAMGGLAYLLMKFDKKQTMTVDETGNVPGGMTPDMSSVITTEPMSTSDMVSGIKGLPQAMKETQVEQALELGRKADSTNSYSVVEKVRAERALNPTSPTKVQSSDVSEDLVNFIKQKEGFRAKAYSDFKQFSIGYGTKANSPTEEIDEAEADRRLREYLAKTQKEVIDFGLKHNYNWDQKKIDALTSFAYNLGPGSLKQVTANGTRSDDEIAQKMLEYNRAGDKVQTSLVKRRGQEFAMFTGGSKTTPSLTPASPTTGSAVASASSSVAEGRMTLAMAPTTQPTIIQDNSTKVQNAGSGQSAPISAWDNFMLENIVSRMA